MRAAAPLVLLGQLSPSTLAAALGELAVQQVKGISVVPGFSDGRDVIGLRITPRPPTDKFFFGADLIDCVDQPARARWPAMDLIVTEICELLGATQVGMITLAALHPGARIKPHADLGDYYAHYRRLHVGLVTNPQALLCSDGMCLNVQPGEIYELDNLLVHHAQNDGETTRVHLIVDAI